MPPFVVDPDAVHEFKDAAALARWYRKHHDKASEMWIKVHKKDSGLASVSIGEALDEALCWGWIDSVAQRIDDDTRRQRWTPRKKTSHWSRVNLELVDTLRAEGRMQPSGLAIWEARRRDQSPYDLADAELPNSSVARLAASPAALAFWEASTASYRKTCTVWILSAKQEATRDRRMTQLIDCSAAGELVPSQRYGDVPRWVERAAAAAAAAR